jgi:hypothetical protein
MESGNNFATYGRRIVKIVNFVIFNFQNFIMNMELKYHYLYHH